MDLSSEVDDSGARAAVTSDDWAVLVIIDRKDATFCDIGPCASDWRNKSVACVAARVNVTRGVPLKCHPTPPTLND